MAFSINGLSSGLDTAQIIKDLMAIERVPYTNLESKKSGLQTEQAVFRQLNTKLSALQRQASDMQYSTSFNKNLGTFSNTGVGNATALDNALAGSYTINVTQLALSQIEGFSGISKGANDLKDKTFTINGESFTIGDLAPAGTPFTNNEDALKALASKINSDSVYGGKASLIDTTGTGVYTLSITATGSSAVNFTIGGVNSNELQEGKVAKFTIDGVEVTSASNTITDVINGVTINLKSTGNSTLTIGKDVEAITKQVEEFVKAYNDIVDLLKTNLAKPENSPTTNLTNPDDKVVVNPLQGDSTLKAIQNELNSIFTSMVSKDGAFVGFMEDIGLSIDKGVTKGSLMTGKITFDKTKFETVLKDNPEKVTTIFTDRMNNLQSSLVTNYTSTLNGMLAMKVTGYDSEIKMVDERLSAMELRLQGKEDRMKLQYSRMEVMLSSLKSEQTWLKSQFDALLNTNK